MDHWVLRYLDLDVCFCFVRLPRELYSIGMASIPSSEPGTTALNPSCQELELRVWNPEATVVQTFPHSTRQASRPDNNDSNETRCEHSDPKIGFEPSLATTANTPEMPSQTLKTTAAPAAREPQPHRGDRRRLRAPAECHRSPSFELQATNKT